jgi:hypothetical protein
VILSPTDTQNVLELLADIRATQSKTIDRLANDWRHALHFGREVDALRDRVSALRSTLPSDPATTHMVGFRRDVDEFKADVSKLRDRIDELVAMTSGTKEDTANIKATLDILQTRFEESDV